MPKPGRRRFIAKRARRGAIAATTIAAISLIVTMGSFTMSARNAEISEQARRELLQNSMAISGQCRGLLELKLNRMCQRGEITRAQRDLTISKLRAPVNRRVFNEMVDELARRQGELADESFDNFVKGGLLSLGFGATGELAGTTQTIGPYEVLGEKARDLMSILNDAASMSVTAVQEMASGSDGPVLTPEEFIAALNRAEQRLQGDDDGASRTNVRAAVHLFFDKWHMANFERTTPEEFAKNRDAYRAKCDADFENFVENKLRPQGWEIQPDGLGAFAWAALRGYLPYRRTFPAGDERYHLEDVDEPGKPLALGSHDPYVLERTVQVDDFTGDETIVFTVVLPESIPVDQLRQVGLPATHRLEFPMVEVDTGSRSTWELVCRGREAQKLGDAAARMYYVAATRITSLFGRSDDRGKVTAEKSRITVRPVPNRTGELFITLSYTLVIEGPDENGAWRTRRVEKSNDLRAVRLPEDLVGDF